MIIHMRLHHIRASGNLRFFRSLSRKWKKIKTFFARTCSTLKLIMLNRVFVGEWACVSLCIVCVYISVWFCCILKKFMEQFFNGILNFVSSCCSLTRSLSRAWNVCVCVHQENMWVPYFSPYPASSHRFISLSLFLPRARTFSFHFSHIFQYRIFWLSVNRSPVYRSWLKWFMRCERLLSHSSHALQRFECNELREIAIVYPLQYYIECCMRARAYFALLLSLSLFLSVCALVLNVREYFD